MVKTYLVILCPKQKESFSSGRRFSRDKENESLRDKSLIT